MTEKSQREERMTKRGWDRSGSVCLDVINQTWSPMFDMINIFEVFLPQLLRYPNPTDPLNGEAAALLMREPKSYDQKVKGAWHHHHHHHYIIIRLFQNAFHRRHASPRPIRNQRANGVPSVQNTFRGTPARMRPTKRAPRARTTTSCPRWEASTTTRRKSSSRRGRWTTYDGS